jgi:hypothetical protein
MAASVTAIAAGGHTALSRASVLVDRTASLWNTPLKPCPGRCVLEDAAARGAASTARLPAGGSSAGRVGGSVRPALLAPVRAAAPIVCTLPAEGILLCRWLSRTGRAGRGRREGAPERPACEAASCAGRPRRGVAAGFAPVAAPRACSPCAGHRTWGAALSPPGYTYPPCGCACKDATERRLRGRRVLESSKAPPQRSRGGSGPWQDCLGMRAHDRVTLEHRRAAGSDVAWAPRSAREPLSVAGAGTVLAAAPGARCWRKGRVRSAGCGCASMFFEVADCGNRCLAR